MMIMIEKSEFSIESPIFYQIKNESYWELSMGNPISCCLGMAPKVCSSHVMYDAMLRRIRQFGGTPSLSCKIIKSSGQFIFLLFYYLNWKIEDREVEIILSLK